MYSFSSRVRYSECDKNRNITIAGLINYTQDTAILHGEDNGVGLDYMIPNDLGWFVTGYHMVINRLPQLGEEITIDTYPSEFKGFIASRAYVVKDKDGNQLAICNSSWVLMNLKKLRPVNVPAEMLEGYGISPAPAGTPDNAKLRPEAELIDIGSFTVSRDMLDTNDHMNNGKYVTIMQKYLPDGFVFTDLKMIFKKALHLDDEVQVKAYKSENVIKLYFYLADALSCIGEFSLT